MTTQQPVYSNFTAGELSPRLRGRHDVERYYSGAAALLNGVVLQQGGFMRSPGTEFVSYGFGQGTTSPDIEENSHTVRLIPFEFNEDNTHMLALCAVASASSLMFFQDQALIVNPSPISVTASFDSDSPLTFTFGGPHGLSGTQLHVVTITAGAYSEIRNIPLHCNAVTSTQVQFPGLDTSALSGFDGSLVTMSFAFRLGLPYGSADIFDIQYVQIADEMFLVHPSYPVRKITRVAADNWTETTTIGDIGTIYNAPSNYPSVVAFHDRRLVIGATDGSPTTLRFSRINAFDDFTEVITPPGPTTADTDAFEITLSDTSRIKQVASSAGQLIVTTTGDERPERGAGSDPLTVSNINLSRPVTNYGGSILQMIPNVQGVTVFVQRFNKRVREFKFVFTDDDFKAPDLTALSEHLFGNADGGLSSQNVSKRIVQIAYAKEPIPMLLCVTADGRLVACTYDRLQNIVAWYALYDRTAQGRTVESCEVVAGQGGSEIWLAVRRQSGGQADSAHVTIELLSRGWTQLQDAVYLDSALKYSGSSTTVLTGSVHLTGDTVRVLSEGHDVGPLTVGAAGILTLPESTTRAIAGQTYTTRLRTLPFAQQGLGAIGRIVGVGSVAVLLHQTAEVRINDQDLNFRLPTDDLDAPLGLFDGVKAMDDLSWAEDQATDAAITVECSGPYPATILAVSAILEIADAR